MIRIIFKITLDDDKIYYTADRNDVVNKINDFHKDDETFKKYNITDKKVGVVLKMLSELQCVNFIKIILIDTPRR